MSKGDEAKRAYIYNPYQKFLLIYDRQERCFTKHAIDIDLEKFYQPFIDHHGELLLGRQPKPQQPYTIYEFSQSIMET